MKKINIIVFLFGIGTGLLFLTHASSSFGATITVNSMSGAEPEDNLCSLREAVRAANTDAPVNPTGGNDCPAGSGDDIIVFAPAVTGTINLLQLADIQAPLDIQGPGAGVLSIDRVGALVDFSYLTVSGSFAGEVKISGLTFANGEMVGSGNGGAIADGGSNNDLVIENCVFTGNKANAAGAIDFQGRHLTIKNSTFSGNMAASSVGGALYIRPSSATPSTALIQGSTFNGNSGTSGGAIQFFPSDPTSKLSINNSTLSGNSATSSQGGGVNCNNGIIHLNNATVVGNSSIFGGGGINVEATCDGFNLRNTILANNSDTAPIQGPDCNGSITSQGYNLIEDTTSCVIGGSTTGNITGQDPGLGALANNGGPTQTHVPMASNPQSLIIDAGNPAGCTDETATALTTDQRGFPRPLPIGAACDIGAVEIECGNIFVEGNEECDDGNTVDGDGCQANCALPICGDGIVDPGEGCDDGNANNNDACRNDCSLPTCGDGIVDPGEACDDGNVSNTDTCLNTCVAASCGDSFVQAGVEACDDGNASNTDACLTTCAAASCGDGFVQAGVETCDDSNTANGDGCSSTCQTETAGGGGTTTNSAGGCSLTKTGTSPSHMMWRGSVVLMAGVFLLRFRRNHSKQLTES